MLTEQDIYLFREGTYFRSYEKLGAHPTPAGEPGEQGTHFAVWAPNAASVSVVGDFNGWNPQSNPLEARADSSGIWSGLLRGVRPRAANGRAFGSRWSAHRILVWAIAAVSGH